jgi:hypothetical protein
MDCNAGKSDVLLTNLPEPLAKQIEEQREKLEQVQAFNKFLLQVRKHAIAACGEVRELWEQSCQDMRWEGWQPSRDRSVAVFLQRLTEAAVLNAADIALSRKAPKNYYTEQECWKYFCGICWKTIKNAEVGDGI